MGEDPDTGRPIVVKDGRFGPYVTDGETNASLRKGDLVEELTLERALELLADRRAAGPTKKKAAGRTAAARSSGTKRTPATKAVKKAAKKATRKAATKKAPAATKPSATEPSSATT
jgi:DNA topoisomerase-1